MPEGFSKKDERQYQHIEDSYRERGKDKDTAEEIAARTVNRERKSEGRTKEQRREHGSQSRSSSSGSSSRSSSSSRSRSSSWSSSRPGGSGDGPTKKELYAQAQKLDIEGRSRMDKNELQRAIQRERR
ncbi:MAG TPA: hypothetical protein VHG08_06555 [Longimicrobium sp.]|nr:hypothetical protein [Longimicrobium sp.]